MVGGFQSQRQSYCIAFENEPRISFEWRPDGWDSALAARNRAAATTREGKLRTLYATCIRRAFRFPQAACCFRIESAFCNCSSVCCDFAAEVAGTGASPLLAAMATVGVTASFWSTLPAGVWYLATVRNSTAPSGSAIC